MKTRVHHPCCPFIPPFASSSSSCFLHALQRHHGSYPPFQRHPFSFASCPPSSSLLHPQRPTSLPPARPAPRGPVRERSRPAGRRRRRLVEWQQQQQGQRRPADGLSSSRRSSQPPTSWTCGSGRRHPRGVAGLRGVGTGEGESAGVSRADWIWDGADDGTTDTNCDTPRISESAAASDNASCFEVRNFARWL